MGIVGRQFGRPDGVLGQVAGRFMARNNAHLNEWVVDQLAQRDAVVNRILELGPGPGVGTGALLASFPQAEVVAVDPSRVMLRQLRRRNQAAIRAGRLSTLEGTVDSLEPSYRTDLAVAIHVVYFWVDLDAQLSRLRERLSAGGAVALGYQLGEHMPAVARKEFPLTGHRLIATDDEIADAAVAAGLIPEPVTILGPPDVPVGRLLVATRPD